MRLDDNSEAEILASLRTQSISLFKTKQEELRYFFAPGRLNLIGEHMDYNGGYVFPCAISYGTYAVASLRSDNKVCVYSINNPTTMPVEFILDQEQLSYNDNPLSSWTNYPKGMIKAFMNNGYSFDRGLNIIFYGNLPRGAGLSSSASIEVLTGFILKSLYGFDKIDLVTIAEYGKWAENNFVGVNCGIMDQFAVANGRQNKAMLLDCATLDCSYVNMDLGLYSIVIANTNKPRALVESKYNERFSECQKALSLFKTVINVNSLASVTLSQFESHQDILAKGGDGDAGGNVDSCYSDITKRVCHVVSEASRTANAVICLKNNDLVGFGKLLNQSHISLRDDYEVTGAELDLLAELAWSHPDCLGSRMTGAGFGGCTISLVKTAGIESFIASIAPKYMAETGLSAEFYTAKVSDGVKELC